MFVTGGGRGIGRAIALAFAAPGTLVAVAGRSEDALGATSAEIVKRGGDTLPVQMDVRDAASVARAFTAFRTRSSSVGVLVNSAGAGGPSPDLDGWRRIIDTNLTGTFLVTREAARSMGDGGRIINLSSVLGRFGVAGYTAYCASKHGIIGLTRALALELAPRGITVNAICPGWVETEMAVEGMSAGARAAGVSYEEFRETALAAVPIKRIIQPDEVAELVKFLASPLAAAITGQAYNICGGQTMG